MKLLLTSGGVSNPSIRRALVDLLGKPIEECTALAIPTAEYGHPSTTAFTAWRFVSGNSPAPMTDLGWESVGLLELLALPHVARERWEPWVRAADVFLVDGGEAVFLAHCMRESGLADLIPELTDKVWVGVSAGSMVMAPRIGPDFVHWPQDGGPDGTLGLVDFAIFPHLNLFPDNSLDDAKRWAAELDCPSYVLDEQSAVLVDGDRVEVVSEGEWYRFPAGNGAVPRRADTTEIELVGGVEQRELYLVEPDPTWPVQFADHEARIRKALGDTAIQVEHIGSTSVPGLAAKPIIDVLVTVPDITADEDYLDPLVAAGYVKRVREPGHRLVRTPARDVHVHILEVGAVAATDYLLLRDHLRVDDADRRLYEDTKRDLVSRQWSDMNAYADAKTDVIEAIKARARCRESVAPPA